MKRTLTLILTVLMLCTLLFGCGQKSGDGDPQDTNTEPALADGVYTADFSTDSSMFHANEACDGGRVTVNGKVARASYDVKVGDVIALHFGERVLAVEVLDVSETAGKSEASLLYREVNAQ